MSKLCRKHLIYIQCFRIPTSKIIYDVLSISYDIKYVGVYLKNDRLCVYVQSINRLKQKNIFGKLSHLELDLESIETFISFEGEIKNEYGTKPAESKFKKQQPITSITNITNNINNINNINVIMVNPVGQETLNHITPDYIQKLLGNVDQDANVVFQFGSKLYSVPENMNFKSSLKVGYVKALLPGNQRAWVTSPKNDAFDNIVENLTEKNVKAVELYGHDVPKEQLEKFHRDIGWITEFKQSYDPEERTRYKRFRDQGLNTLSENISDKKRRIERDNNQLLKLL